MFANRFQNRSSRVLCSGEKERLGSSVPRQLKFCLCSHQSNCLCLLKTSQQRNLRTLAIFVREKIVNHYDRTTRLSLTNRILPAMT